MRAYVVERSYAFHGWSKRICPLHHTVFGGIGDYRSLVEWEPQSGFNEKGEPCAITRPPAWSWPAVTNANRCTLLAADVSCRRYSILKFFRIPFYDYKTTFAHSLRNRRLRR